VVLVVLLRGYRVVQNINTLSNQEISARIILNGSFLTQQLLRPADFVEDHRAHDEILPLQ
jgi:hypothetical protein